jgi:8-oxo-dGTP pyrophosphatase MutT (NUDIX family)
MKRLITSSAWNVVYFWPKSDSSPVFLLAQRSDSANHFGQWNFFGGRIDFGETPKEAAQRELKEESNLDLPGVKLNVVLGNKHFSVHYFLVKVKTKLTPKLNGESQGFRWMDFHTAMTLNLHKPTLWFFFGNPLIDMLKQCSE